MIERKKKTKTIPESMITNDAINANEENQIDKNE